MKFLPILLAFVAGIYADVSELGYKYSAPVPKATQFAASAPVPVAVQSNPVPPAVPQYAIPEPVPMVHHSSYDHSESHHYSPVAAPVPVAVQSSPDISAVHSEAHHSAPAPVPVEVNANNIAPEFFRSELAPVPVNHNYPASSPDQESISANLDHDGYHYKTVRRLVYKHRS